MRQTHKVGEMLGTLVVVASKGENGTLIMVASKDENSTLIDREDAAASAYCESEAVVTVSHLLCHAGS